jgi:hypothetical protein
VAAALAGTLIATCLVSGSAEAASVPVLKGYGDPGDSGILTLVGRKGGGGGMKGFSRGGGGMKGFSRAAVAAGKPMAAGVAASATMVAAVAASATTVAGTAGTTLTKMANTTTMTGAFAVSAVLAGMVRHSLLTAIMVAAVDGYTAMLSPLAIPTGGTGTTSALPTTEPTH